MKLVAFYSRADENYFKGEFRYVEIGNTAKVAKMIAEKTGADLFEIEQVVPYAKDYKTCVAQAVKDWKTKARPELVVLPENFDQYDEIYLGYPNYCGTMPMAVYTFLEALNWQGKTIYPFCTNEGSGLSNTEKDIQKEAQGAEVMSGLSILGREADQAQSAVEEWLKK